MLFCTTHRVDHMQKKNSETETCKNCSQNNDDKGEKKMECIFILYMYILICMYKFALKVNKSLN